LRISILWTSVFTVQMMTIILSWIQIFLMNLIVMIVNIFSCWRFTYNRRILSSIHNRSGWTSWCCLGWRHLSCCSLLLISTDFININWSFRTLLNGLTVLRHFRVIWDTAYAMVLVCFGDITSKSWLISCVTIVILINSILRIGA
jgi:hypothetical protein